ncbi:rhodopsin kinase GRK7 isoform X4 [Triticum aestivum]|nr:rhodopsin kinase GRK7-like isoform X4 [Triticum aestivum]XP_044321297.1 rhodopsin kinase GRK7-like isoform X4 [Triticum aestivum]
MGDIDSLRNTLVNILLDPTVEAKQLPLSLFENITDNFSDERVVGRGGFGTVYKGFLPNDRVVAVKRLKINRRVVDDKSFYAEVASMKMLRNKNVVRLLGYCIHMEEKEILYDGEKIVAEKRERLLCMEFVPHGPVKKGGPPGGAEWPDRHQIIKGICNGLDYIHSKGFIHLDLKPDNILLDKGMVPKIADFGISRFFDDENTSSTLSFVGTRGYTAPEYIDDGLVSNKADIYSLGTVIFELLTDFKGPKLYQKAQEDNESFVQQELEKWTEALRRTHQGCALEFATKEVETCLRIALNCKDHNRHRRRTAKQISQILDLTLDPYILDPDKPEEAVHVENFSSLQDMDLHPSQPWILLSLLSGYIVMLNYDTKVTLAPFKLSDKPVHSAKFVEGNRDWNIVAGDDHGVLYVCNFDWIEEGLVKVKTVVASEGKGIISLAVNPSQRYVLLSTGSTIMIRNTEDWTCMYEGPSYFRTVTHASFNTDKDESFGVGFCDGSVKLWSHDPLTASAGNQEPYVVVRGHSEQVCSVDYFIGNSEGLHSPARFLVTGSMDKTAKVWKYDDKPKDYLGVASVTEPEATLKHAGGVTATCYVPELKIILSGTDNGVVTVWCAVTYSWKRYLCFGLGRVHSLACSTGGRIFIGHEHGLVLVDIGLQQL